MATESRNIAVGYDITVPPLKSIEEFIAFVAEEGLHFWSERNQETFFITCQVRDIETRLSVIIDGPLLHLELAVPGIQVTESSTPTTSLALCRINSSLRLPGFSLQPGSQSLTYRLSVPIGTDGLSSDMFKTLLATSLSTAEDHWEELAATVKPKSPGSGGTLHAYHPILAPSSADPYMACRAYLRKQGPVSDICVSGDRTSCPDADLHDLIAGGGCVAIWDWFTGELLGLVEPGKYSLAVEGRWQPTSAVAFADRLQASGSGTSVIATRLIEGVAHSVDSSLNVLGFGDPYDEVVVERSLQDSLPIVETSLTWSRRSDVPLDLLDMIIKASDNRALDGMDAAGFLKMSRAQHKAFSEPLWRVAEVDGEAVGIVHFGIPDERGCSGLELIGVLPEFRGRGLGRALHAKTLHALAQRGGRHYRDKTDVGNLAMQRIFFWNGCRAKARTRSFRLLQHR